MCSYKKKKFKHTQINRAQSNVIDNDYVYSVRASKKERKLVALLWKRESKKVQRVRER